MTQVAKDLAISESCPADWLRAADIEGRTRPGVTREEFAELREPRKRNRLPKQENEVLHRAAAHPIPLRHRHVDHHQDELPQHHQLPLPA
ncbi:hypothetical protein [Amycolatopsis sp. NPDC051061]|uniref:hypothetical protein n=1 Tax=Amycolatopsis sp. NPDC051061 TaxID=3155042 RepID=UPI003412EB0C